MTNSMKSTAQKPSSSAIEREFTLRSDLKRMAEEDDDRHYQRVVFAVELNALWEGDLRDKKLTLSREDELDGYVSNMGFSFREFKKILDHFPQQCEWRGVKYADMYREAVKREQEDATRKREALKKKRLREASEQAATDANRPSSTIAASETSPEPVRRQQRVSPVEINMQFQSMFMEYEKSNQHAQAKFLAMLVETSELSEKLTDEQIVSILANRSTSSLSAISSGLTREGVFLQQSELALAGH